MEELLTAEKLEFSNRRSIRRVVLINILSCGLYNLYWFYKNWQQLKKHNNLDIMPIWRTISLFIPIIGLVVLWEHIREIKDYAEAAGVKRTYSTAGMFLLWLLFLIGARLPEPWDYLGLLSAIPLALVQRTLNSYWDIVQPNRVEAKLQIGEVVVTIIGLLLWAALIYDMLI